MTDFVLGSGSQPVCIPWPRRYTSWRFEIGLICHGEHALLKRYLDFYRDLCYNNYALLSVIQSRPGVLLNCLVALKYVDFSVEISSV